MNMRSLLSKKGNRLRGTSQKSSNKKDLEVVAERPIAQHFEKGMVVRIPADIFEI